MTEDETVKRLAACRDIADLIIAKTADSLNTDQLDQLNQLQEDVFETGFKPDFGVMKKAGLTMQQLDVLIDTARIAFYLKRIKERDQG